MMRNRVMYVEIPGDIYSTKSSALEKFVSIRNVYRTLFVTKET